ncbi:MAG: hypothetical protein ABL995_00555 [Bryobacteraceae bacterium]
MSKISKKILSWVNNLLSLQDGAAWFTVILGITGAVWSIAGTFEIPKTTPMYLARATAIVVLSASVLLLRFFRWSLISWGIRHDLEWFRKKKPYLLVGIGPGGAIVAGMIAKHLADSMDHEPFVFVINRKFSVDDSHTESVAALSSDSHEIRELDEWARSANPGGSVVLVASETKTGDTLTLVRKQLPKLSGPVVEYVFLFRPIGHLQEVGHCTIKSLHRGILPWMDSPDRPSHAPGD